MADGFDIHIDNEQAAKLKAAASRADMSPEAYALALINVGLASLPAATIDPDPAIDEAIADAVERGEEPAISLDDFRSRLRRFGKGAD
ncbi:antitoxin [Caulobacter sp. DWR1-3-2b1]|uniref:antitoxin n=1 Tax=Caulobacter sp. DWR1-3-2b1 TaxID=2804670 RepID=UPI003CF28065